MIRHSNNNSTNLVDSNSFIHHNLHLHSRNYGLCSQGKKEAYDQKAERTAICDIDLDNQKAERTTICDLDLVSRSWKKCVVNIEKF